MRRTCEGKCRILWYFDYYPKVVLHAKEIISKFMKDLSSISRYLALEIPRLFSMELNYDYIEPYCNVYLFKAVGGH